MQTKVLKFDKSGAVPFHFSSRVFMSIETLGLLFIVKVVVTSAFMQNSSKILASDSIHFTLSIKVLFILFATPFYCGV